MLAAILTVSIRYIAIKKSIMDIPNERSSHIMPTPRGGGIAILIVFYIGLFYFRNEISINLFNALLWAIPIAAIGLLDDVLTLSSKIRLLVQSISSLGALYSLGGVHSIDFSFFLLEGSWLNIFAFISILWLTNLYNFLDGIDGYAASESITIGLGLSLLFNNPLGLVIVAASLGFLVFNWHRASIFMGDVGSATLGFIFAIFIFSDTGHSNIVIWLILLSLFWVDATLTLVRRLLNGETITQAHRKHLYQRLVQSGWKHDKVVIFAVAFNLIFLSLLLYTEYIWLVFMLNIISLVMIIKYIDKKESFR